MPSLLSKKLSILSSTQSVQPVQKKQSRVIIKEYSKLINEKLYSLDQNALLDMGLTGGTFDIEKALFIDTETTGLSGGAGTVAFLIGIGFIKKGLMTVRQYLIPDYSCEAEMLIELSETCRSYDTFVHFNGSRFDIPLIRERFIMKRLDNAFDGFNELDLLPPSRKVWKLRLGCCRLKYLEETVLGMPRDDSDIPGSEIPARYFECVKTGNLSLLDDITDHNRQDILTLADLLLKLNGIYHKPECESEQLDIYSLGRTFEHLGNKPKAKQLYSLAALPRIVRNVSDLRSEKYSGAANYRLFLLYRRSGEYEKCEAVLRSMIKRRQMENVPYIELAKLLEHKFRRYTEALEITDYLLGNGDDNELLKRKQRLENKLQSMGG